MTTTSETTTPDRSWIADITMTELERNPYQAYERLRQEAPLAFVPVLGSCAVITVTCPVAGS